MRLDHAGAAKFRPRAGTARDGFVVLILPVAEGEIAHGAAARGHDAERAIQCVGHAHGSLDISRYDCRGRLGVQHARVRQNDPQRLQAARVQRNVIIDQGAKYIQNRGGGHGAGRVEIVVQLGARAGEVDASAAARNIDTHRDLNMRAIVERQRELAVFERCDDAAHGFFRVILHVLHVGAYRGGAILRDQRLEL